MRILSSISIQSLDKEWCRDTYATKYWSTTPNMYWNIPKNILLRNNMKSKMYVAIQINNDKNILKMLFYLFKYNKNIFKNLNRFLSNRLLDKPILTQYII